MYSYFKTLLIIFLVCLCSYFNIFKDPFQFDGVRYIKENPYIIGLVERNDYQSFFSEFSLTNIFNRPFLNYSYAINYYLGKDNTLGYHLLNLLIHFANCLLVYLIIRKTITLSNDKYDHIRYQFNVPLVAALIFASHPAQTQTVTYIISRSASLSTFLYLCSFYCFLIGFYKLDSRSSTQSKLSIYGMIFLSLLSMRIALGVKLIIVSLPVVMVVYYYLFFYRGNAVAFWHKNRFQLSLALSLLLILIIFFVGNIFTGLNDMGMKVHGRLNYLLSQIMWFVFYYLKIWVFPFNLNIDPDVRLAAGITDLGLVSAIAILVLLGLLIKKQSRLAIFGFIWMVLSIAPESSIIPLLDLVAEQRLYLPATGLILGITAMTAGKKWVPLYIILITCFTVNTINRNTDWTSEKALWRDTAEKSPGKWRPYSNYARALEIAGESELALINYQKAIKRDPNHFETHHNLGNVYVSLKKCDLAIEEYTKALSLKPDVPETLIGIGKCHKIFGDNAKAISYFKQALELKPEMDAVYRELGAIYYFDLDDKRTAGFYLQQALRLNPKYPGNAIILNMIKE